MQFEACCGQGLIHWSPLTSAGPALDQRCDENLPWLSLKGSPIQHLVSCPWFILMLTCIKALSTSPVNPVLLSGVLEIGAVLCRWQTLWGSRQCRLFPISALWARLSTPVHPAWVAKIDVSHRASFLWFPECFGLRLLFLLPPTMDGVLFWRHGNLQCKLVKIPDVFWWWWW